MFTNDRQQLRQFFFDTWRKHQNKLALIPLEEAIIQVLNQHPEYHHLFNHPDQLIDKDFSATLGEANPFLHLSLHLSLHEQLQTNRPNGITSVYQTLLKTKTAHDAEHLMMDVLAETLWDAQKNQTMPDESTYLTSLKTLIKPQ